MKTTITKISSRSWEWTVGTLAGGFAKTKFDAENDAAITLDAIERKQAREAGRIAKGDPVTIKPEWQDEGDGEFDFFAAETQLEGMDSIRVRAAHRASGNPGIGVQSIRIEHMA